MDNWGRAYSKAIVFLFNFQLDIFTSGTNIEWTNKHPQETSCHQTSK